LLVPKILDLS